MTRLAGSCLRVAILGVGMLALGCATTGEEEVPSSGSGAFGDDMEMSGSMTTETIREGQESLSAVYFDYDRWDIRDEAKGVLQAHAAKIRSLPAGETVTIEGNCDERGTEEYNLALGERRANSVRKYLIALGVPASKLTTVSFGEEQPAVRGHDESAWRWNRRAEFRINP